MSGRDANHDEGKPRIHSSPRAVEAAESRERDANEVLKLAADVQRGLEWMANYSLTGTEQTLHIDFQGKARELLPALDELVALVGTLQDDAERERDCFDMDANGPCGDCLTCRAARADALEAQVGTLQQERDEARRGMERLHDWGEDWKVRAVAAEARAEALQQERDAQRYRADQHVQKWVESDAAKTEARAVAAEAALATTRQALAVLVRFSFLVKINGERAKPDDVEDPALRETLFTILKAEDTEAAVRALTCAAATAGVCSPADGRHYFEEGLAACRCGRLTAGAVT